MDTYNYYKGLIAFRKAHPALRLTTADEVDANVTAVTGTDANVVAFNINGGSAVNGETADALFVIFNGNNASTTVTLPEGEWNICINGQDAGTASLATASGTVTVDAISAMVLVKGDVVDPNATEPTTESTPAADDKAEDPKDSNGPSTALIIGIIAVVAVVAIAVIVILLKKKK